jgi:hypothetical protein
MNGVISVADEAWIALAQLTQENPDTEGFRVTQAMQRVVENGLEIPLRPGVQQHLYQHGVADKPARPNTLRYFRRTRDGARRLWRPDDIADPSRTSGRTSPRKQDLPPKYHGLLEWYHDKYCKRTFISL